MIRWWRSVMTFIKSHRTAISFGIVAAVVVLVALWFLPPVLVDAGGGAGLKGKDRVDAITNERRTVLAALAGLAAVFGLVYTALKHQLDRESHQLDRESAQLDRDSNVTERYTRAIEQLGHDSIAIRLGGLYSLDRIAADSERDRETIGQVMMSFIRVRTTTQESGPPATGVASGPAPDVVAALTLISRKDRWTTSPVDLTGANLEGANLEGAILARANLRGANLTRADLTRADLTCADLSGTNLEGAHLWRTNLNGALFFDANLTGANLSDADLTGARLSAANLTGANLAGAGLACTNLSAAEARAMGAVGVEAVADWRSWIEIANDET